MVRLVEIAATLLLVFVVCFLLLHGMPGDPVDRLDSPNIPADQAERNRRVLGLDRPLPIQFLRTLAGYATGDLGVSFSRRRPVIDVLGEALPPTALLGGAALLLAYGLGLPLSVLLLTCPTRVRAVVGRVLLALAIVPRFWLAVMLIFLLHGVAGWFPASHAHSPGGGGWLDLLRHLVLPSLSLGLPGAFVVARYQLEAMQQVLDDPHVKAARAAGGGGVRLLVQHVLRPSIGPAAALFGLDLPILVSGAIVVELIFAWPGLGRLTADAVLSGDYPLALASCMLTATLVILGRLLAQSVADRLIPTRVAAGAEAAA